MFLNSLSWKKRLLVGCAALFLTLPFAFHLNQVSEARRFARLGVVVEAQVIEVHPEPKHRRAYTVYRYSFNEREHTGTLPGANEWRPGSRLQVTVDPAAPEESWPGEARADVGHLIAESLIGAVWLAAGVALLAGPRKESPLPKNHLLSE